MVYRNRRRRYLTSECYCTSNKFLLEAHGLEVGVHSDLLTGLILDGIIVEQLILEGLGVLHNNI